MFKYLFLLLLDLFYFILFYFIVSVKDLQAFAAPDKEVVKEVVTEKHEEQINKSK